MLSQGEDIVPIPGTKHLKYLESNLGALEVQLTEEELKQIDALMPKGASSGARYHEQGMQWING